MHSPKVLGYLGYVVSNLHEHRGEKLGGDIPRHRFELPDGGVLTSVDWKVEDTDRVVADVTLDNISATTAQDKDGGLI